MTEKPATSYKLTFARFFNAIRNFATSDVGWLARLMFAGIIALLFVTNGMNVLNSFVGRDFMTAIADRDKPEFIRQAFLYVAVFGGSTLIAVMTRYVEERLGLLWREFLTNRAVHQYLSDETYYALSRSADVENPDQRIAEDVKAFTVTTLSFILMLLNSIFTLLAFSGVLWSISPLLLCVAVLYSASGSYLTLVLGRPLVGLNSTQLDKEANFRSSLIHVRENAEAILLAHREERMKDRLLDRFRQLVENFRRIIAINRNVGFFTTGYNWMIQIIPALLIAPAFIDGEIEFGVITQSAMAFSLVVAASSLIVTQFQSISSFVAVVTRLSSLVDSIETADRTKASGNIVRTAGRSLTYENFTLQATGPGISLIKNLSLSIPARTRVLLAGPNEAAKAMLFKATAGLPVTSTGKLFLPDADELMFLAQRPYLPPGTVKQVLVRHGREDDIQNDTVLELLSTLNITTLAVKHHDLNNVKDWATALSLREQQLLAFAHILLAAPGLVFLDRASTALGAGEAEKIVRMLSEHGIGYINNDPAAAASDLYDAVLAFADDGSWTWTLVKP